MVWLALLIIKSELLVPVSLLMCMLLIIGNVASIVKVSLAAVSELKLLVLGEVAPE